MSHKPRIISLVPEKNRLNKAAAQHAAKIAKTQKGDDTLQDSQHKVTYKIDTKGKILQKLSTAMNSKDVVLVCWSGGLSSTYHICDLALYKKVRVQPIYIRGVNKAMQNFEIANIKRIYKHLKTKTNRVLEPILIDKVPTVTKFYSLFDELATLRIIGTVNTRNQVINYGPYAKMAELSYIISRKMDVCICDGYSRDRQVFVGRRFVNGQIKKRWQKRYFPFLKLRFPLLNITKQSMIKQGRKKGFRAILNMTKIRSPKTPREIYGNGIDRNQASNGVGTKRESRVQRRRHKKNPVYSFRFVTNHYKTFEDHQNVLKQVLSNDNRWTSQNRTPTLYDYSNHSQISKIKTRIDGQVYLTDKFRFAQTFSKYFGKYVPRSYLISNRQYHKRPTSDIIAKHNVWFLKPSTTYGGSGIRISGNPNNFPKLTKYSVNYVVQPHVNDIMLINNKKFDIRIYVLFVFKRNQPFICYIFREGMMKFTVSDFKDDDLSTQNNLTNKTFQSKNRRYDPSSTTMLFTEWEHFDTAFQRIKECLLDMSDVISRKLHQTKANSGYWLSGCDFMFDNNFNPWLLEINGNPGMNASWNTPDRWDKFQVASVKEMIDVAIIPLVNSKHKPPNDTKWEYLFTQN